MRWLALGTGIVLIGVAFAAATRVADTREGLIAEVITLLGGLAGISFLLYGLFAGARRPAQAPIHRGAAAAAIRPARELAIGSGGLVLAAVLLSGLAISGGWQWAALGLVLLLPMIAGSAYLCARFLRAR
jgi:hypothetical protein